MRARAPLLLLFAGCAQTPPSSSPTAIEPDSGAPAAVEASPTMVALDETAIEAIVSAPDRMPADLETDARRQPRDLLAFLEVGPGMRVADLGAGTGYMTELLARAVGPNGVVFGQNTPFVLERFAAAGWAERLARPVNAGVVRMDTEFDAPFTAEAHDLDLVVNVLFYHDMTWMKTDRAAHNAAVFAALRPGGRYVIVDHSAADGAADTVGERLHRIEEALVRQELEAAGFRLAAEAQFLRNPDDTRDWNALPWRSEREMLSDKFVLAFEKPG